MEIGVIGLGQMGSAIARRLIGAGHRVTVYNRTRARAEALEVAGAVVADRPVGASTGDAVITMLADDQAVEAVVLGNDGVLQGLREDAVHLSMSTTIVALGSAWHRRTSCSRVGSMLRCRCSGGQTPRRPASCSSSPAARRKRSPAAPTPVRRRRAANIRHRRYAAMGQSGETQWQLPDRVDDRKPRRGRRSDAQIGRGPAALHRRHHR